MLFLISKKESVTAMIHMSRQHESNMFILCMIAKAIIHTAIAAVTIPFFKSIFNKTIFFPDQCSHGPSCSKAQSDTEKIT